MESTESAYLPAPETGSEENQTTPEILALNDQTARLIANEVMDLVKEHDENAFLTSWCSKHSLDRGVGICLAPYADESSSDSDHNASYFIQIIGSKGFITCAHRSLNEAQMRGVWEDFKQFLADAKTQLDSWNHRDLEAEDALIIPNEELEKVKVHLVERNQ